MKSQKVMAIFMLFLISFSTIIQPVTSFATTADIDIGEKILEVADDDVVDVIEEPLVEETETGDISIEDEEVITEQDEQPVKNKGDPVVEMKQNVDGVEGESYFEVEDGEEFNFNIKTDIPTELDNVEGFTITDVLDSDLTIVNTSVLVEDVESDIKAAVDGQEVTLNLIDKELEDVKGKNVELQITSSIKEEAVEKEIENIATSQFDDGEVFESNEMTVKVIVLDSHENDVKEKAAAESKAEEKEVDEEEKKHELNEEQKDTTIIDGEEAVEEEPVIELEENNSNYEEIEQDEDVSSEGTNLIVAELDEVNNNPMVSLFNLSLMSAGVDISKDVIVSNLSAVPNSGSSDVWDTQFGKLRFDLDIPNHAKSGDTFEIKISGITNIQDFKNVEQIKTGDGRTIGEFSYKRSNGENILTGTLHDEINNKINVSIKMDLGFKIDESYRGNETPENINSVKNKVTVSAKGGNSETFEFEAKLFDILSKISVFNNIHGNENFAELETVARISSSISTVNEGVLTLTPEKGFSIPKDPKIELQGWVYTKQSDGTYKVESKKFEVEVLETKKDQLVIKTPKLENTGAKIELLRIAVKGEVLNPSKIDYKSTSTDTIQVKGEFNSSTPEYKDLVYVGDSNLYYSESIGADAEEVEGTILIIKQDGETKERLEGAVFEVRDSKGKLVKEVTTNKNGTASVGKLPKDEYTIKEIKAPKGYELVDKTKTIKVEDSKEYVYTVDNTFVPTTPSIVKDVEGKKHLEIEANKNFKYNVKSSIPSKLNGYKDLTITDKLDNRLNVVGAKVLVDGESSELEATIDGQTVTLELDRKQLDLIAGKEVNVRITASIKAGTDIELIDNKANIQLNDNPKVDSNIVTVIPPTPETPKVVKDVEGEDHLEVEHEKAYKYNVKTDIPTELGGYKDLTITDKLDDRLNVIESNVLIDGEASDFEATIDGQTVTLELDRKQLNTIAGKEVNVQITASIKSGTDIELIDNKADIQLNNDPKVDSNVVTVIPPTPETPELVKDVEGKDHLEIGHEKAYKYNVKTNVPAELGGYKDLTITDKLDDRLNVIESNVLVDGEASDFEATIDGQTVTLELDRKQLNTIAGKEVNVQITASIKTGTDIELIDNKADIQLNDDPKVDSNVVTVVPPTPVTPELVKDVEGEDHLEIEHEKAYKYNVKTDIPTELGGYEDLTITDKLDDRLNVIKSSVLVDGEASDFEATIDGQTVTLKLDRKQLNSIAGKEINVQITASVKSGTDIENVPNKATIQLNDNSNVDSNIVTVVPIDPIKPLESSVEPTSPEDPKEQVSPSNPKEKEDKEVAGGKLLPKTATGIFNMFLIGMILLVVGGATLIYVRKRNKITE